MPSFSKNGKRLGRPPKNAAKAEDVSEQDLVLARAVKKMFANRYDAAGRGRRMAGWDAPTSGPNAATIPGLQTLRDRSSDAVRNDWSAEATIQKWATTIVGIAITPRWRRIKDPKRRQEIADLFEDCMKSLDADCLLHGYGMQTLSVRSWLERGEVFARYRARNDPDLPLPFQVQLLESDMCPLFDADSFDDRLPVRNKIRSGKEFNQYGKCVAYWFYKQHPSDGNFGASVSPTADQLVRVAASEVVHMFEPKRIGQLRGVPILAPILAPLRSANDFADVTMERQKIANLFVAFVSRQLPTLDPTDPNTSANALTGLAAELGEMDSPLLPMKPGLLQELDDGQSVTFADPPDPATNYSDFMRTSFLGIAAGAGLPYEFMSGDLSGVSDRALRVLVNELRRFASQRQWQIVIPMYCQAVVEWFAKAALLAGKITLDEMDDVIRVEHAPHGWEYIHPVQDVQGKALEVQNGFTSRSAVISARGDDPDKVDAERAADQEREELLGLPVTGQAQATGAASGSSGQKDTTGADGIDNNEYDSPTNPSGSARPSESARIAELFGDRIEASTARDRAQSKLIDAQLGQIDKDDALMTSILALLEG